MGVLDEDWLRTIPPDDLRNILGGILGGPMPPGAPLPQTAPLPPRRPPELTPMQIPPEQRLAAQNKFIRENPYGLGRSERETQPTDTRSIVDLNQGLQNKGMSGAQEEDASQEYARLNPPGRTPPAYRPEMPYEYAPRPADAFILVDTLRRLRNQ